MRGCRPIPRTPSLRRRADGREAAALWPWPRLSRRRWLFCRAGGSRTPGVQVPPQSTTPRGRRGGRGALRGLGGQDQEQCARRGPDLAGSDERGRAGTRIRLASVGVARSRRGTHLDRPCKHHGNSTQGFLARLAIPFPRELAASLPACAKHSPPPSLSVPRHARTLRGAGGLLRKDGPALRVAHTAVRAPATSTPPTTSKANFLDVGPDSLRVGSPQVLLHFLRLA